MSVRPKRRTYYVDKEVQGELLVKAARYWILSVIVVAALTIIGWIFITPGIATLVKFRDELPSLIGAILVAPIASLLVLPVVLYDLLKLSNRFAGPMFRLRRLMGQVADGEKIEPVRFRQGDYWHDFAEEFNRLLEKIETAEEDCDLGSSATTNEKEDLLVANS